MRLSQCHDSAECVVGSRGETLGYIPSPNRGANLFSTSAENETLRDDKGGARLDAVTRWGNLSAYYFADDYFLNNPYPTSQGGANVPGFNALTSGRAQLMSFGWTKTIGTNAVNEFHFSYARDANLVGQPQGGVGPSLASQGFVDASGKPSIYALAPEIEGIESVVFNDFTMGVDTTGLTEVNNTYQWTDDYSRTFGKHTLRLGGGYHIDQINITPDAIFNGSFALPARLPDRILPTSFLAFPARIRRATPTNFIRAINTSAFTVRRVGE